MLLQFNLAGERSQFAICVYTQIYKNKIKIIVFLLFE